MTLTFTNTTSDDYIHEHRLPARSDNNRAE
jgi:hypothetical protein